MRLGGITPRGRRSRGNVGGATQKTSVLATGLAPSPVPSTSRITPPTPVALPPYGSMAVGWLGVSTLNDTAPASSNAITPALSLNTLRQKPVLSPAIRSCVL